jgi:hypothetical protein
MKPLLIGLLISIAFPYCKKENKPYEPVKVCAEISNKKEAIDQYLQGSWRWLEDKRYSRSGEVSYEAPATAGIQESVSINASQIVFTRTKLFFEKETTTFNYKIVQEGDLTTFPSDEAWVMAIYDPVNGNRLNWWRIYICQRNLIMSNAYRGELYPDRTYQRQ